LEGQKASVEKFVQDVNGEIIAEYQDIQSGRKIKRDGLNFAIAMCIKKSASLVVGKIDRLSRDGFRVMTQLQDAKIEYIDASSPNDTNVIKEIKFALAKNEVGDMSERIIKALAAKRARGETLGNMNNLTEDGRQMGPEYMKINARTHANNVKASIVIKALKKAGWTYQQIANELNGAGFVTRTGLEFHSMQVRRLYLRTLEEKE
jgi:DNA invertase Pin-like site-specific DNA recombinase